MLDDLKSFFTTSSVAEVGVGVTIGAAFAALIGAFTEAMRSLISGDPQFGSLVQAAVVLLSVVVISLFGVVKPLMALKDRMGRAQAAKVADAVQQVRSGEPVESSVAAAQASADETAADADPSPGSALVDPPAGDAVDGQAAGQPGFTGTPSTEAGWPTPSESTASAPDGQAVPSVDLSAGAPATSAAELSQDPPAAAQPYDPLFGPLPTPVPTPLTQSEAPPEPTQQSASLASGVSDGSSPSGAAAAAGSAETDEPSVAGAAHATAPRNAPHAATTTKVCPFCAFDIPAVATRCGWCTSDLGDLERGADPVLVET